MVCRWLNTLSPKDRVAMQQYNDDALAYSRGERDKMARLEAYGL